MLKKNLVKFVLPLLAAAAFSGCASHRPSQNQGTWSDTSYKEYHSLYFSEQPTEKDFAKMKEEGMVAVINLRTPEEMKDVGFDSQKTVENLGMKYYAKPWDPKMALEKNRIVDLESTVMAHHKKGEKVLLFCKSGQRGLAWFATHVASHHGDGGKKGLASAQSMGLSNPDLVKNLEAYLQTSETARH